MNRSRDNRTGRWLIVVSVCYAALITMPNAEAQRQPLFQILDTTPGPKGPPNALSVDPKKPLLSVSQLQDAGVTDDRKGIVIHLTPADTRKLAQITRSRVGRYLAIYAEGQVLKMLRITGPIDNGYLSFKSPEQEKAAAYFRKRLGSTPR